MLVYIMWRTLHGFHCNITVNFMVAGHTKFAPDWCFGLLKQKYHRTPVSCLEDIVWVTDASNPRTPVSCLEDTVSVTDASNPRTPVSCLEDIVRVTNMSTLTGVNLAQLIGSEEQSNLHVPLYNWQGFLSGVKPLAGMKQYQHFRYVK